ncbi:MAG: LysR family transcriptional regulator [Paucimonas sp.]|jgi:DNA-binding transcriptional LysR family regulator|uniref:LysR family transcriptional regulator n=1 Tax=Pantoea sp. Cy-639 TaxID=2608360 RepID=UPI00141F9D8C|nr:LysR family transcriptional regulator [Pantoea sp. Cy-639]MDR2308628.1 LysR family transcriptional regulator [Paucimonas sp.]NIF18127.1 LysR family transcriptional regulator [Pantoea sp. Cy-639]
MNWDDARMLLALSREQTLRRAARVLRVDQATVGRRVAALEADLGSTLFLRTPAGYQLTAIGEVAVELAQKMEQAALELTRRTRGADNEQAGEVRIATTDSLAHEFVIPALRLLHAEHPEVRVVLSGSSEIVNLSQRETDIAIRNQRPDNPDLVLRKLASWQMGLFASADYLQRRGTPADGSFAGHDLVVYEPYWRDRAEPTLVDVPIGAGRVVLAANASMMLRRGIGQGLGIGEIPVALGLRDGLRRVWPQRTRREPYEVWMVTHQDLRHTARVRAVIEHLAQAFADEGGALPG